MQMTSTSHENPTSKSRIFLEKLSQLEQFTGAEQKQIIEEVNGILDEMERKELESVLSDELSNKIHKMIKEKKLSMENAILLLKHIGYLKTLKRINIYDFEKISLGERIDKMNAEEEEKKEKKNEKLLADLCECYLLLNSIVFLELIPICISRLLKVVQNKEENEDIRKEVEMALLALSISGCWKVPKELYLNKITEIIKYHQEHHNLTQLAYLSAWGFLIDRLYKDESLEEMFVNELHFIREAEGEIEDLSKSLNLKMKEEGREKEPNEVFLIGRWFTVIEHYFSSCKMWNEEITGLIRNLVRVFRLLNDKYPFTRFVCICSFDMAARNRNAKIDVLLKSGAMDAVFEEIQRQTLEEEIVNECLILFLVISRRMKFKEKDEIEEAKRKATKRKIFEKLEEEGHEDTITSIYECIEFFIEKFNFTMSLNISDYLVNV